MKIHRIADLLQAIAEKEVLAIERKSIKHAPTIGAMYEAVTADMLERVIPSTANVNVLQGFIRFPDGSLSRQIDCMIVQGEGEKLHDRLDQCIVPIADVITVIEVKKTLYSDDLRDSFELLRAIPSTPAFEERYGTLQEDAVCGALGLRIDLITSIDYLSPMQRAVMLHITKDAYRPARIALGYLGFQSHSAFRSAMLQYLTANLGVYGFGPVDFPDIMISGHHCLVKLNGIPYSSRLTEDGWPFLASYSGNPLVPLLEVIWTRLSYANLLTSNVFGEDLYDEAMPLLLTGRFIPERHGWEYWPTSLTDRELDTAQTVRDYQPVFLTKLQFDTIWRLCLDESIEVDDSEFIDFIREQGVDPEEFLASLVGTRLVSIAGGHLCLLTRMLKGGILRDGRYAAGENVSGRFDRWFMRQLGDRAQFGVVRYGRSDAEP